MVVVQLNIDVIAEILSRLRVKDLIRFKSVCKSWLQLISTKGFIKLHLQRSSLRPIPIKTTFFGIDCHHGLSTWSAFSGSSWDGLVCLLDTREPIPTLGIQSLPRKPMLHIWNPALRSSACIPIEKCPPHNITCFWFGLHNDEYKLVLGTRELEMHVLRPYTDSCYDWKSTQKLRDGFCNHHEIGTLFNGHVHWLVCKNDSLFAYGTIMSYDLHLEKVGDEIVTPVFIFSSAEAQRVRLGEVDGCLSALVMSGINRFELWAMKEYGVQESWTKLMVFDAESALPFLSINLKEVVLDDPATIKSPLYRKEVYVESLVSPKMCTSHKKSCRVIY